MALTLITATLMVKAITVTPRTPIIQITIAIAKIIVVAIIIAMAIAIVMALITVIKSRAITLVLMGRHLLLVIGKLIRNNQTSYLPLIKMVNFPSYGSHYKYKTKTWVCNNNNSIKVKLQVRVRIKLSNKLQMQVI